MRLARITLAAASLSLLDVPVVSADCLIAGCNPAQLSELSPAEREQLNAAVSKELKRIERRRTASRQALVDPPEKTAKPKIVEPDPNRSRVKQNLRFYLRKDFEDITLFSGPALTSSDDAVGASLSYTYDQLARDSTLSAEGIVAVSYSYINQSVYEPFKGFAIGPYFGITREVHSSKISDNVDVKTFGVSGEVGWRNPIFTSRSDYIRGSLAAKRDDIAGTDIAHGKLEWLPTWLWDGRKIALGSFGLIYNFTPEFLAQYDRVSDVTKTIAFSGQREALRVGPEAVLWLKLESPNGLLKDLFQSTSGRIVYHSWIETYSGRSGSWLDTSLVHNLDPDGLVALTLSYRRGQNEDTGVRTDLYKVALSAKLCADVFSKDPC